MPQAPHDQPHRDLRNSAEKEDSIDLFHRNWFVEHDDHRHRHGPLVPGTDGDQILKKALSWVRLTDFFAPRLPIIENLSYDAGSIKPVDLSTGQTDCRDSLCDCVSSDNGLIVLRTLRFIRALV